MGMNFYLRKKVKTVDQVVKNQMKECIDEDDFNMLQCLITRYVDCDKDYHLGKRSLGWTFTFYAGGPDNEMQTLEDVKEFIRGKIGVGYVIEDEYGKEYSELEFWLEVAETKQLNPDGTKPWNMDTYIDRYPSQWDPWLIETWIVVDDFTFETQEFS